MRKLRQLHEHVKMKSRRAIRKLQYDNTWQKTIFVLALIVIVIIVGMIFASTQFDSSTNVKFYAKQCYDKLEYITDSKADPLENSTQQTIYALKGRELTMTHTFIQKCHGKLKLDSNIEKEIITIAIEPVGMTENCLCKSTVTAKIAPIELPKYTIKTIKRTGDIEYLVEEKTIETGIKAE